MSALVLAKIVVNAAIAVLSVVGWLMLVFGVGKLQHLASRGLGSLKYFTVLSNLFSGLVSAVACVSYLTGAATLAPWLATLKLAATAAVMLTFLTVIVLLGPYLGWKGMYAGGNFWLHLALPLAAAFDLCLLEPIAQLPVQATFAAVLSPLAYAVWYVARLRAHANQDAVVEYDFYGFLRWGTRKIPIVAAAMFGATWVIALMLWLGCRALHIA